MNTINELQDLCDFAVSIDKHNLYIWWIRYYKTLTNNKSMILVYDSMIEKLQSDNIREFEDPASIAEKNWGVGSKELFPDGFDLHEAYYFDVLTQVKLFFVNKIFILSNDQSFQTRAQFILNNLATIFSISRKYNRKEKSTFHHDSWDYKRWKLDRDESSVFFLNWNMEELKKLVDEYS